jgi:hypothetical protein
MNNFVLNDGIDEEAPPEERLDSSQLHISIDTLHDSDIFPSNSVSTLGSSVVYGSKRSSCSSSIRSLRGMAVQLRERPSGCSQTLTNGETRRMLMLMDNLYKE